MPTRDQVHRLNIVPSIPTTPIAGNVTTNGVGVDTAGYEAVTLLAHVLTRTDGTYTFKVQTSPDDATWVDLTSYSAGPPIVVGQVIGGTNALALTAIGVGLLGVNDCQRYVRAVDTSTGVTTGGSIMADFILGEPRHSGVAV